MSEMQFTSVDRIFATLNRNLGNPDLNESDVIEWIGDALDQLKVPQVQEQAVMFLEVKDFHADIPQGLQLILQVARNNSWAPDSKHCGCPTQEEVDGVETPEPCEAPSEYRPYFDMQWQYIPWTTSAWYSRNFTPVRLANNVFFKSLVCKEKSPYRNGQSDQEFFQHNFGNRNMDEYTIVGTMDKKLRFSFREGQVAIACLRSQMDPETGYPYIPDNISFITAITYFIKWKLAEMYDWNGREGFASKADKAAQQWEKYARQAKNWAKMPKSIDDFQDLLEQSHYLIPRQDRYYNYFGNLGRPEERKFNDPDFRSKRRYYNPN